MARNIECHSVLIAMLRFIATATTALRSHPMGMMVLVVIITIQLIVTVTTAPQDTPIPATSSFELPAPFACNDDDIRENHTTARSDPEWAQILLANGITPAARFL